MSFVFLQLVQRSLKVVYSCRGTGHLNLVGGSTCSWRAGTSQDSYAEVCLRFFSFCGLDIKNSLSQEELHAYSLLKCFHSFSSPSPETFGSIESQREVLPRATTLCIGCRPTNFTTKSTTRGTNSWSVTSLQNSPHTYAYLQTSHDFQYSILLK